MTQQQNQPTKLDAASARALLSNTSTAVVDTQSPLREFEGTLDNIEVEIVQGDRGAYHRLTFKFTNLAVYRSVSPWPYPVGDLKFSKSGDTITSGSPLGMLLGPIDDIWGPGKNLFDLVSHRLYINFTPGHSRRVQDQQSKQWVDEEVEAYEIIAINGQQASASDMGMNIMPQPSEASGTVTQPTADAVMLNHLGLEGKTQAQFNQAVLSDQDFQSMFNTDWNAVLTSSESVLQSLIGRELVVREGEGDEAVYKPI